MYRVETRTGPEARQDFGIKTSAHVAQLVEHTLGKGEVTGSTPVMGSTFVNESGVLGLLDGSLQ